MKAVLLFLMTAAIASLAFTTGSRGGIVNSSIVSFHQIGLLMIALFYVRISDFSPLFELRNSRNIVAVLLICLVLLSTSASYANSPLNLSGLNYSLERLMQVYLHLLCFIVVCYLCVKECYVGKYFLMAIGISLAVVAVYCWSLIFFVESYPYRFEKYWNNWLPFNSNKRHMGFDMLVGAIINLGFALSSRGLRRLAFGIFAFFCASLIIWLGGRATTLALIGTLILFWRFYHQMNLLRHGWLFGILFFSAAALFAELGSLFDWNGLFHTVTHKLEAPSVNHYSSGRFTIWTESLLAIKDHWVLGLGPQSFFHLFVDRFGVEHPHNAFVQILIEFGVAGLVLFLVLFCGPLYFIARVFFGAVKNVQHTTWIAAIVVLGLLFQSMFSGIFFLGKPSSYLAMALAIVWADQLRIKASASTNPPPGSV